MRITKTGVDKLTPPDTKDGKKTQKFYRDSTVPGFAVRITSGGAISFIVEKRINGKVKRQTLGRYGAVTVDQAKKAAQAFLGSIAQGNDPIAERKSKEVACTTLEDAFEDYLASRKDLRPSTIHDYTRSINGIFGEWKSKKLTDITKDMAEKKHREYGARSPARANNALRVLRAVFNHAMNKYEDSSGNPILQFNPVDRISQTRAWYKITARQGYIKPHELHDWYQATLKLNNETTRDYIHLILFTGLRRSEASRLAWKDIDFKDKTLTIPVTKNHVVHVLPLSDYLYNLLESRYQNKEGEYVFPSNLSECGYLTEPRTAVSRVCELSEITFTLHDLRRTFITYAEGLDIPAYALKRLLNHKDPNDVTAGYIVSDINRLREPMQKITDFILKQIKTELKTI